MDEQLNRRLMDINNNVTGRIIVGESPAISTGFIPEIFQAFHQKYPGVWLSLREGTSRELVNDVMYDKADLAFTSYSDSVSELIFTPVIQREIFLIHKAKPEEKDARVKTIHLEDLKNEPFILLKEDREDYQIWLVYRKDSYLSKPMQYFMKLAESFENEEKSSLI